MAKRRKKRKSGCYRFLIKGMFFLLLILVGTLAVLSKDRALETVKDTVEHTVTKQFQAEIPYEEVKVRENTVEEKFYYGQLGEENRTVYKEILQGLNDHKEEIYVHSSDAKETNRMLGLVLKDCPEIFWCDGTAKTTTYGGDEAYTVLKPVYSCTREETDKRQKEIDEAVAECLLGISAEASDYDKICYVFDYIVDAVEYDTKASDNQNIYSVFAGKRSVCAGYSKATQYLLERLGVFCAYVTGKTKGGENHAWNLVRCSGDYYYVDTTWGDPVFQSEEEAVDKAYVSYDYLCCDDKELFKTHIPDDDAELPKCEKMDFNYYVVNGMYYQTCDEDKILKSMNDTISKKENPSVFKFADSDAYSEAKEAIFGGLLEKAAQNLARWYQLKQVKYTYIDDAELNKIVVYWTYE